MVKKISLVLALIFSLAGGLTPAHAGMSAYTATKIMGLYFNGTAYTIPTTIYIGLMSTCPTAGSGTGGTEAAYTGYARQAMAQGTTNWTTVTTVGLIENATVITFPNNTGSSSETENCYAAWDASTGGDLLDVETLKNAQTINVGAGATFAVDALKFSPVLGP